MRWPATSDQEVAVLLTKLLQGHKLDRIYGLARARLIALLFAGRAWECASLEESASLKTF